MIIVVLTALTTTTLAMFCSVIFSRTSVSLMTTYLVLLLLFAAPVAVWVFAQEFSPTMVHSRRRRAARYRRRLGRPAYVAALVDFHQPLGSRQSLPLTCGVETPNHSPGPAIWWKHAATAFMAFYVVLDVLLLSAMLWLFHRRWRVWS